MHSPVLDGQLPCSFRFSKYDLFSYLLWLCIFVYYPCKNRFKLDPTSFKYVFFGIVEVKKDKCYYSSLHKFVVFANITFSESTTYIEKALSKRISLEPEDNFMFFLENSSSSSICIINRDKCIQDVSCRYVDMLVVLAFLITDMISGWEC